MVGLSLAIVGVSMALVQVLLIGRLVARYGERTTALIGLSVALMGQIYYIFGSSGVIALLICTINGLQGMVMPSLNAMMSRRTPANQQGELQGFNGSLAALAALIAPLIYNTTLSHYSSLEAGAQFVGAPFVISASLVLIAIVSLARLKRANQ